MKILVVSGFLGAGKTTFIKALARFSGRDFTVLENEYGSIDVDSKILKKQELDIVSLSEGCICCSMRGDFRSSILTIKSAVDPEYLVIEPTGVGMLSNVISLLKEIEFGDISILSPLCVVDPYCFGEYSSAYGDIYLDQIKNSGQIILSHIEESSEEEIEGFKKKIRSINPDCEISGRHYEKMDESFFLDLLKRGLDGRVYEADNPQTPGFENFVIGDGKLNSTQELINFLQLVLLGRFGKIIRAKGLILVGGELCRFDVADMRYGIIGEEDKSLPVESIYIGEGIKRDELRKFLLPGYKDGRIAIKIVDYRGKGR
ncbi:MAG: GTP-binding protein [Bacillota bacterium]|nr:GTP-binding protein [Bacillota bacterium]